MGYPHVDTVVKGRSDVQGTEMDVVLFQTWGAKDKKLPKTSTVEQNMLFLLSSTEW